MEKPASNPGPGGIAETLLPLWTRQARDYALVMLDPAGVIAGWMGAAELIFGYAATDVVGRHVAMLFTDEDRHKGYPDYEMKVAADDQYSEDSRWHRRQDGTLIWISGTVTAVRDASGEVVAFMKVMRDMTDQRTQLQRFENRVEELVSAREKTHAFLRTLGHEIRNPLSVLGNLEMIFRRLAPDERGQKAVQQLGNQVAVLKRLSDDLMDVSRLELGKVELQVQRQDLRELLQQAVSSVQGPASEKSLQVETVLPPSPLVVSIDPTRMQQVVLNLLGNAIKYNHAGGSIWVKASEEGGEIVCRVQDTGIGIFPPVLPRLFDLFAQAPEAREQREGGIGVGLALVRQIVELHGGTVQAKSSGLGKGSEFAFRLPRAD